jgi:hypothetical protein
MVNCVQPLQNGVAEGPNGVDSPSGYDNKSFAINTTISALRALDLAIKQSRESMACASATVLTPQVAARSINDIIDPQGS